MIQFEMDDFMMRKITHWEAYDDDGGKAEIIFMYGTLVFRYTNPDTYKPEDVVWEETTPMYRNIKIGDTISVGDIIRAFNSTHQENMQRIEDQRQLAMETTA